MGSKMVQQLRKEQGSSSRDSTGTGQGLTVWHRDPTHGRTHKTLPTGTQAHIRTP